MLKRGRTNRRKYRAPDVTRADVVDYIDRFHHPRMRRRVARQEQTFSDAFKPFCGNGVEPELWSFRRATWRRTSPADAGSGRRDCPDNRFVPAEGVEESCVAGLSSRIGGL